MPAPQARPTFAAGPPSCTSFDSDVDTDIDSRDADLLDRAGDLHLPHHPLPRQFSYPNRHSSLTPDTFDEHDDIEQCYSPTHEPLSGEDKQFYDNFWADFHEKRRQRQAQAPPEQADPGCSTDDIMDGRPYYQKHHDAHAYQLPRHRQPLVNFIRNGWQADSRTTGGPLSPNQNDPGYPTLSQLLSAPRLRRWLILFIVSIVFLFIYWARHGADSWNEQRILRNAVSGRIHSDAGWFGTNMLPEFVGMTHVKQLKRDLVPQVGSSRRLIFVGDVHGCHDELEALLSELDFKMGSDHLVFTGDLISKGPSSPAVVDLAIASHASCVRGNHEDRVLLAYRDLKTHAVAPHTNYHFRGEEIPAPPHHGNPNKVREAEPDAKVDETIDGESFSSGDHVNQQLARALSGEQIEYLASCPVILDVGPVDGLGDVRVVHAGLVPGVSLQRQDPISVMHMRTLDLNSHVPSPVNDGMPWNKIWNKFQTLLPKDERSTVIYGHDSARGLQLAKYSKGLDTGCVKGGKLTALIFTSGNNKNAKTVSVDCKDYRPKRPPSGDELGQS
ncbi:MAG: hypothetical protein Q9191_007588 [Dirinaria sp. TL-2023a]